MKYDNDVNGITVVYHIGFSSLVFHVTFIVTKLSQTHKFINLFYFIFFLNCLQSIIFSNIPFIRE